MRLRLSSLFLLFSFALLAILGSSCKKEQLLSSGGELRFSNDTLTFDTVFTALGSATVGIKIYNPQDQRVTISSVRLGGGGTSSSFRLNVDGKPGAGTDIEVAANDSIYVFATVTVNPTDVNSPFVVEDKLIATLNGRDFSIPVLAYGQNAHYIRDSFLRTDTWRTDKPYVVLGYAVVDSGQTLHVPAGCRIYMHQNARLFVLGTLDAQGTKTDSIIFQGDRLDRSYFGYEGYPGEWGGIYFAPHSVNNLLRHVVLRNCGNSAQGRYSAAIEVRPDSVMGRINPQLTLDRCTIENSIGYGLLAFDGYVQADNCLIHSCGASALALVQGGKYELNNCTIATYGNAKISHIDDPTAIILNYFYISQTEHISAPLKATLRNCVIAGSLTNEAVIDSLNDALAEVSLSHCLLKAEPEKTRSWVRQDGVRYSLADGTLDPQFIDVAKADYHPKAGSPLKDAGAIYSGIGNRDLDDKARQAGAGAVPDIGCYEVQQ